MVTLILTVALIGVLVYAIETFIPMPAPFRLAIRVIVVLVLVIYLVRIFGLDVPLPRLP